MMRRNISRLFITVITIISVVILNVKHAKAQCSQWNTIISAKCLNSAPFTLTGGTPIGGIYIGPGVTAGVFNPATAGVGTHKVGYHAFSCTSPLDTAYKFIVVNAVTAATLTGLDTAYCIDNVPQTIVLTKSPTGGTLTGPGVSGGNFNIGLANVGKHKVKYYFTNSNNCTDTAISQVHVRALPTVNLTIPVAQKFVCEFDAPFPISGGTPGSGWPASWYKGTGVDSLLGTFGPSPSLLGWNVVTYYYYDGMCQNFASDSIEVKENPTVVVSAYPVTCIGATPFTLTQGSGLPTGGTGVYSGLGVSGGPTYIFNPAVAGVGTHQISYCYTSNGCQTCVTQNINVVGTPSVVFNIVSGLCENGPAQSLDGKGIPTGGYFSGPGIQLDSLTLKPSLMGGPGSYTLTYTFVDTNGCSGSAPQTVTVNPKPVITITVTSPNPTPNSPPNPADVTVKICEGDTAFFSITGSPAITKEVFVPTTSVANKGGTYLAFPQTDINYLIICETALQCKDTALLFVDVIPPALADITGKTNICIGDTTTLTATGANSYKWIVPPVTAPSIDVSPKANTLYQVVAESDVDGDGNLCSSDTGEALVTVNLLPLIATSRDTLVFYGDKIPLKAYGGVTYTWVESVTGELSCTDCNFPIAFPIYQRDVAASRWYYAIGTDTNGCINGDTIFITLNPKIVVFVPNAFSPNNDGINDIIQVETKGIASIDFEIFDRFGHTVFETKDLTKSWDGTYNGELLNKDVYLYRLKAFPYEKIVPPIDQAGEINLIR